MGSVKTEPPPAAPSDVEVARYLAAVCAELRNLADRPRLRTIRYLLEMARLEAEREAGKLTSTRMP